MRALSARIKRLEKRTQRASTRRTLIYRPPEQSAADALASVGSTMQGRVLLCPDFGSDEQYERALLRQQRELIAVNARTPAPPKKPEAQHALPTAHEAAPTARIKAIKKLMRFNR